MKHLFSAAMVLLLATGALLAQGFGGGMPGGNSANTLMVSTPKGLFAMRAGVLAKFNLTTLKTEQVFELFGPLPERPANATDRDAMGKYFSEMQRRNAPPIMLVKDNALLIVIGDGFARLDQDTLQVEATGDLRAPGAVAEAGGPGRPESAPGYLLVNNTLFLMRSGEMISLSVTDGKILARSPLPKELQPQRMNYPMGDRGDDRGGDRGGRGNN